MSIHERVHFIRGLENTGMDIYMTMAHGTTDQAATSQLHTDSPEAPLLAGALAV